MDRSYKKGQGAVLFLWVIVLLMMMAMPMGNVVAETPEGFTAEIRVSTDHEGSYFPAMVTDDNANIHLFWLNATGRDLDNMVANDGQIFYTKISPHGEVLVPEKRVMAIYPDDGQSHRITPPSVDIGPDGRIHVAWADDHTGTFTIYYMKVNIDGEVETFVNGLTNTTVAKFPSLDVDQKGDIHITWAQWEYLGTEAFYPNIYYMKMAPDGEVIIPRVAVTGTALASNHPAIAVDQGAEAHIIFEENVNYPGYSDEIYYCTVDEDGELVVDMQRVSVSSGVSLRPDIAIDRNRDPHAVWTDNHVGSTMNVYYARLDDLSDIDAVRITYTVGESNAPRLFIDRGMDIHIIWSQNIYIPPLDNSQIWYAVVNGDDGTTSEPARLTYEGLGAKVPTMTMDTHNNVIVAWDDYRDHGEESKYWDIYYMRTVKEVNQEPIGVLEIDGALVDSGTELRYHVGDEVVLFAGNSTDPDMWDEAVEYNFTISHDGLSEASGWSSNSTYRYTFEEEGGYVVYVRVRDGFGKISRPDAVFVKVTEKRTGKEVTILSSPQVRSTVIASGIGLTATIGYLVAGTEIGKYKFSTLLLVPLYSRIKKEKTLDNYIRGQIHGYILAKPGCHYNQIKQTLDLNNGTLAYHLRKLEKEEFIKSDRDGMYKRFYPVGLKIPRKSLKLSNMQVKILDVIRLSPGISQKEVANEVGISAPAVIYHIGVLSGAKLVKREKKGSRVEYRLIPRSERDDLPEVATPAPTSQ